MKFSLSHALVATAMGIAFAAPAHAEVSLSKARSICKDAAYEQISPEPTAVRGDRNSLGANDSAAWMEMRIKSADGEWSKVKCEVDRETGDATITDIEA